MRYFVLLALLTGQMFAANHYVRAAASGTGAGTDWTNACTDFTGSCAVASLVRGDTYFISTGTYAGTTFSKAVSGSLVITIQRATIAVHGTDTGWSNAFDGTVTWGELSFTTGYWLFDGVTPGSNWQLLGSGTGSAMADYGFNINHAASCASDPDAIIQVNGTNLTIRNVAMSTCGSSNDTNQWCILANSASGGASPNLTVSRVYCANSVDFIQMQGSDDVSDNDVFEYIYTKNNGGSATHHGEVYQLVSSGTIIRYNYFNDCGLSGGVTSCISGNAAGTVACGSLVPMCNLSIYGNVFNQAASGSGVIHAAGSTGIGGVTFVNNTITNLTAGNYFDECTGHTCPTGSGNNLVKNNLIWNGFCGIGQFGLAGDVEAFNSFLSCTAGAATGTNTQSATLNPFSSSSTNDYRLANAPVVSCASTSAVCAGTNVSTTVSVDAFGTSFGSNGNWERGAFAFVSGGNLTPAPALGLFAEAR